jgi:hypothetical protein
MFRIGSWFNRGVKPRPVLVLVFAVIAAFAAGCGSAAMHTIQLSNQTSRTIQAVYIYPLGAADHGASRTSLAPNAKAQVKVKAGNVEVLAVSEKVEIDEHTRDQPSASHAIELTGPVEVVFYDDKQKPMGLERQGVIGVAFTLHASNAPHPDPESPAAP